MSMLLRTGSIPAMVSNLPSCQNIVDVVRITAKSNECLSWHLWGNHRHRSAAEAVRQVRHQGMPSHLTHCDLLPKPVLTIVQATFFTPAHSIESFPKQLAKVRDAWHEIGLHGYTHEYVSQLSANQQRDVLVRSIDALTKFTGKKPLGYTAPSW